MKNISTDRRKTINELMEIAINLKENGEKIISFGGGAPKIPLLSDIKKRINQQINSDEILGYTSTTGLNILKKAIAQRYSQYCNINNTQVVISNGSKQCLFELLFAIIEKDNEVIIPCPYWNSYPDMIELSGGIPVAVELNKERTCYFNLAQLESAITPNTRAILLNSPHNPTGKIMDKKEMEIILKIAQKHDLFIISDEVYLQIAFENAISYANYIEQYNKIVIINSFSKSLAIPGWRVGYMIIPNWLQNRIEYIQSNITANPCNLSQVAAIYSLEHDSEIENKVREEMLKRRNLMYDYLAKVEEIDLPYGRPDGALYILVDVSKVIDDTYKFCKKILHEKKILLYPGETFGANKMLRLSFTTSPDKIVQGIERLAYYLKNYTE